MIRRTQRLTRAAAVVAVALSAGLLAVSGRAEDADRPRAYMHFGSGEFNTAWDVHDYWHLSVGMNFDLHWGAELAGDAFELNQDYGEISVNCFLPQLRFRYPLLKRRLVPYALVGVGGTFMQFNDAKGEATGQSVHAEGWRPAATLGAGLEYFLTDSITFAVEGKYLWAGSLDVELPSRTATANPSTFLATIGLRAYFDENQPRPFAAYDAETAMRVAFGAHYGGAILLDNNIGKGLSLVSEPAAYWDTVNQAAGLTLSADFGENWGVDLQLGGFEPRLRLEGIGDVGEYATFCALPMARLRLPVAEGRIVPYFTAGVGAMFSEFNDSHHRIDVDAKGFHPVVAVGGGVEYFIHRSVSFTADAWWQNSWGHDFQIGGESIQGDFSSVQFQLGFRLYLFEKPKHHK